MTTTIAPFTILNNGNVGIGTTAPGVKLHVVGDVYLVGSTLTDVIRPYSTDRLTIGQGGGNVAYFNSFVGINENTPTAQLQVKSGATDRVGLAITTTATTGFTANIASFSANNGERALINSNGAFRSNVGLANLTNANNSFVETLTGGTVISRNVANTNPALIVANTSSTANIQVWQFGSTAVAYVNRFGNFAGDGLFNASNGNNSYVNTAITGTNISRDVADGNSALVVDLVNASSNAFIQRWAHQSSTKAYISKDGVGTFNRGLEVISDGTNETLYISDSNFDYLYVEADGDVYNKNGTYGTISDLRLKENIKPARSYTEDLMKLNVVKYSFKSDKSDKPTHLGFIAQEVAEVFPSMVETHKSKELEDMKTIKMSVLIPMLVKTIQELKLEIDELKKKI
jgi:hypothetical protein